MQASYESRKVMKKKILIFFFTFRSPSGARNARDFQTRVLCHEVHHNNIRSNSYANMCAVTVVHAGSMDECEW